LVSLPNSIKFRRTGKEDEQLEAAAIAIDECSMVDMPLMSKLLDAVPPDCDLYLLGDKNQLVSVEAGSVFADICAKFKTQNEIGDPLYTELTENRRAEKDTGIDELSKNILYRSAELNDFNCKKVKHCQNSDLFEFLAEAYRPLYNARTEDEALALLAQFQVLCAIKKGPSGTFSLNYRLKKYAEGFLENRKKTEKNAKMFYPLIIAENDYTHSLFNGDVGVSDGERAYFLSAEGKAEFPVLALPAHENAYAITIHKSQGSEYQKIAVVYPEKGGEDADHTILTRELLYTAVTRAREECAIFGSLEVLKESIKRPVFRASGIN
jgi:exodeoxyribonuclease V alpha subunit